MDVGPGSTATPISATVAGGTAPGGNLARVTTLRLRPEDPADTGPVGRVLAAAFARPDVLAPPEVGLVEELRGTDAWIAELAMVAEYGGEVVGYALLTRVRVRGDDGNAPALALGPVAVAPHRQRIGHGTAVVQAGLDAATELGERLVVVLGSPAFYRRFGFTRADRLGLTSPWSGLGDPWQALVLPASTGGEGLAPRGEVLFPSPWSKV
ncbi:putative acetyltransferase [Micromonospora olivasterospora]|uniref:Putative acetyltransferase n=1 Tax=Micromonospora olivasterospora TaxID=1880 RepID=A0A562I9H7_MICOL|nr:putative acetyltransferase [Micromonospora olivasterospora]